MISSKILKNLKGPVDPDAETEVETESYRHIFLGFSFSVSWDFPSQCVGMHKNMKANHILIDS